MLGSDDLRPETRRRAPDPSLHEMLRRAREAHLGDSFPTTTANAQTPNFVPLTGSELHTMRVRWLESCAALALGLLLGAFITFTLVHASLPQTNRSSSDQDQNLPNAPTLAPVTSTDTPLPTPTDTPVPTPETTTIYPSADDIVSLAQDYIDNQSDYAGSYIMTGDALLQIEGEVGTKLTVCIQFDLANITEPDSIVGTDIRTFVMTPSGDGAWQVIEMDSSGSCSLS